ncbi:hypothetical protein L249_3878 [Ophiocordyceps polyrhachis-furcata BCC 54312]|uniref:Uncharacterized protein n=1 Tax=Ophiocordyceps polyrhachis-furcata BCC 54312 TaxID=1330021 RepID=A0A367L625_9HYPO|nr:hypothetical protein L249_3878 [Ophiocordyceps polyrhachis-furcata BCC 54312]
MTEPSTKTKPQEISPQDRTVEWKPRLDRTQSWNREDRKHSLHMPAIDAVKTGPGFSEKKQA